jgi:hypothetical protein
MQFSVSQRYVLNSLLLMFDWKDGANSITLFEFHAR